MVSNPEADALKARRKAVTAQVEAEKTADLPPLADRPVMVGEEISRRFPLLGDPREPRAVFESSGALFGVESGQEVAGYVIAPEAAYEVIIPAGCRTGTTRMRWAAGQHVPTEVYEAWREANPEVSTSPGAPS